MNIGISGEGKTACIERICVLGGEARKDDQSQSVRPACTWPQAVTCTCVMLTHCYLMYGQCSWTVQVVQQEIIAGNHMLDAGTKLIKSTRTTK